MSSKSIYQEQADLFCANLNLRTFTDLGIEFEPFELPDDATSEVPKGMPAEYYYAGGVHPFLGKTHSDEHKAKLSILMKEKREANPELFLHDQPHTQETKNKLSEALMGNTNKLGKTGYKLSDEFKDKCKKRMLSDNPMSNPEAVERVRQVALKKFPCKACGRLMNKGNLSRHEPKCK